jgi:hypothetical protein
MIEDLASVELPLQLRGQVHRLNRGGPQALDVEWEIAVLAGLSRLGRLQVEVALPSGARPDIHFWSKGLDFIGDVEVVTNRGVVTANPVDVFAAALIREVRRARLRPEHFRITIGDRQEGKGKKSHFVLALPPPALRGPFCEQVLRPFLEKVQGHPNKRHAYRHRSEGVDVDIVYDPAQQNFAMSHRHYGAPQSRSRNPLASALNRKATQLPTPTPAMATIIFACDGGADALRSDGRGRGTVTTAAVVGKFLRDHRVSGVCLIAVEHEAHRVLASRSRPKLGIRLYFHSSTSNELQDKIRALCVELLHELPAPGATPLSAEAWLEKSHARRNKGRSFTGGYTVTDRTMRLSARAVLELLAGQMSQEAFLERHGFTPGQDRSALNPLLTWLQQGRLLVHAAVERSTIEDDDWLILTVGDPDPAVTPFRVPPTSP